MRGDIGYRLGSLLALGWLAGCNVGRDGECTSLCEPDVQGPSETTATGATATDTTAASDGADDDGEDEDPLLLDVGAPDQDPPPECDPPQHSPCDAEAEDPFAAMGVNCPGEPQFDIATLGPTGPYDYHLDLGVDTPSGSIGVRSSFGGTSTFDPREGESYAVIGSGFLSGLSLEPFPSEFEGVFEACNSDLGPEYDPPTLPEPIQSKAVDCDANPALIGTGDCSGTLEAQFLQGIGSNDWSQLTFSGQVPNGATSLSFDFAFFSYEYPEYIGSQFNDIFVAWLESDSYSGNISFDGNGRPITLNASFLDFKDANYDAPEFEGTCMQGHAGTNWLSTSVGMTPGENFQIAFAVFDTTDSALDSFAFIDNVEWGCDVVGGPVTEPAG